MTFALACGDSALAVQLAGSVQPAHIATPDAEAGRALCGIAYLMCHNA